MDVDLSPVWRDRLVQAWQERHPGVDVTATAVSSPLQGYIPRDGTLPPPAPPPPGPTPPGRIPRDGTSPGPGHPPPRIRADPRMREGSSAPLAVRVLAKMGYGHSPQDLADFTAGGGSDAARLQAWIERQLDWASIDDGAVEARLAAGGYQTLGKSLPQLWSDHVRNDPSYTLRMQPAFETQRAAFVRAVHSRRQLRELMVEFWHNHFNVFGTDFSIGPVLVHYDRDVIRANAMGNFRDMLEAVARSTAMLYYLDNISNTRNGPNENFARELLELHTLGAENYLGLMNPFEVPPDPIDPNYPVGYTDIDVYETAAAFTGWSARNGHWQYPGENDGTFVYRAAWHDQGPKFVLGMFLYPEQPALQDGHDVLDRLASHPGTARFVCRKLVRRLVADTPPEALVNSAAQVFRQHWRSPDQIARVLRHILGSEHFLQAWGHKQRRPFEVVVAAMRAIGTDFTMRLGNPASNDLMWLYGFTGHAPFAWPAPNGYPDTASAWNGSNALAMSWRVLNHLPERQDGEAPILPVVAISRSQVPNWTASALVDFWTARILRRPLASSRRQSLLQFMAQNGDPRTYVITDTDSWAAGDLKRHYNHQRLRTLVSLLLASPEFFER
ncbi:DUF1800 domain-containing protein [Alkalisalibacterium limincola]|nr:DUF1800 domain-containing protein [Alkalisalibacterium limincola]